jgi:methyl-accepting chemotaxis protein
MIDGDSFEALSKSLDPDDPFYEETRLKLLELKNYSSCLYLYTMAPLSGDTWMFIIDGSVPPDDEELFSPLGAEENISSYDTAFLKTWETVSSQYSDLTDQETWGWMVSAYTPIVNSAGERVGIVGCDFGAENLFSIIKVQTIRQILIILVFIGIGFVLMMVFLRIIFGRLSNINAILKEIAAGAGDLTKQIHIRREDEIGEIARYFNLTLEKIKHLIITIKNQTVSLFNIGNELASNMDQAAAAVHQITAAVQDVKSKVINQSASVTETAATMEQVTVNIDKLNSHVEEQTVSVSRSSSAIEEMLANIQSVTQTLIHNAENVQELTAVSEIGRSSLQAVSRDIQEIARESEGILEINSVMQNIASQTNLLSMNAAIEAAHAGEAGKGFAVVADEIRKLAENSGAQSKTISTVLKKIKDAIDGITRSTNMVLDKFQAIDDRVRIVSDQETNIRNAMEEQNQGSRQILEAVGRLNELTQRVKQGSLEIFEGSKGVIRESKNLENVTLEITGGMNEMAGGADQINSAVNRVNEISSANKEFINALVSEVSKFKVE